MFGEAIKAGSGSGGARPGDIKPGDAGLGVGVSRSFTINKKYCEETKIKLGNVCCLPNKLAKSLDKSF